MFSCQYCQYTSSKKFNVIRHEKNIHDMETNDSIEEDTGEDFMLINNDDEPETSEIICSKCNKTFIHNGAMNKHMKTCDGTQNKLQCQLCNKIFASAHSKCRHMYICIRKIEEDKKMNNTHEIVQVKTSIGIQTDDVNEILTEQIINDIKPKSNKKSIPSTVKRLVWNTHIGKNIGCGKCTCCNDTEISQFSFHCGHIVSEANGGFTVVSNLKPICQNCNSSMGTRNMNDFMKALQ